MGVGPLRRKKSGEKKKKKTSIGKCGAARETRPLNMTCTAHVFVGFPSSEPILFFLLFFLSFFLFSLLFFACSAAADPVSPLSLSQCQSCVCVGEKRRRRDRISLSLSERPAVRLFSRVRVLESLPTEAERVPPS